MKIGFQKKLAFKITTPEIICDVFSFLDKDQIERIQLVNQFWNNVIIRHKNILPLRQFGFLYFRSNQIYLYATNEDFPKDLVSYKINFDGTNLSKIEEDVLYRYSQLTVDEVLTNLNDVVFHYILLEDTSEDRLANILNLVNFVTTKTGVRFHGRRGYLYWIKRFDSKLAEIIVMTNCVEKYGVLMNDLQSSDSYISDNDEFIPYDDSESSIIREPRRMKKKFGANNFPSRNQIKNISHKKLQKIKKIFQENMDRNGVNKPKRNSFKRGREPKTTEVPYSNSYSDDESPENPYDYRSWDSPDSYLGSDDSDDESYFPKTARQRQPFLGSENILYDPNLDKEKFEHRTTFDSIRTNAVIPQELLLDVLCFNERESIEKYGRLVSKRWNNIIETYRNKLPLHKIKLFRIRVEEYINARECSLMIEIGREKFPADKLDDKIICKQRFGKLKYCYFEKFEEEVWVEQKAAILRKMVQFSGEKIRARVFSFCIEYHYETFLQLKTFYHEMISACFEILNRYCDAELVYMRLNQYAMEYFYLNLQNFYLPPVTSAFYINFAYRRNGRGIANNRSITVEALQTIYNAIGTLHEANKYYFHFNFRYFTDEQINAFFEHKDENFCRKYVEMFINAEDPSSFIQCITIVNNCEHFLPIEDTLERISSLVRSGIITRSNNIQSLDYYRRERGDEVFEDVFIVKREDDWVLEIVLKLCNFHDDMDMFHRRFRTSFLIKKQWSEGEGY